MCAPEKTYKENEHPGVGDTVAAARAMRHESTRRFKAWQRIPSVRSEPQRLNGGPPKGNRMVFVVDDQPDVAEFAKTVLDHAGFPTAVFLDGIIAWHAFAFANIQPRVLVVYDTAANVSGRELIRLCRTIKPDLKVILLRDDAAESARLGPRMADVVLARPYGGAHLLQAVRWLCATDQVKRQICESNGA